MKTSASCFFLALIMGVHLTDSAAGEVHAVATGSLTFGGDDWQVARAASGDPLSIHGGGGAEAGAGILWQSSAYPMASSLVANYHVDDAAGVRKNAQFRRVPIDVMAYYTGLETLRVGLGLSMILAPTVSATVDGAEQRIRLHNATGKMFELGYAVSPSLWANLRLASTKYKPKAVGSAQAADVTQLALSLSYLF